MHKYRRFNYIFSVTVASLVIIAALINVSIDPYAIWGSPTIYRINRSKPETSNHERLYKAIRIIDLKPSVVFLGSSRALIGLDPDYYNRISGTPAYNLALEGGQCL